MKSRYSCEFPHNTISSSAIISVNTKIGMRNVIADGVWITRYDHGLGDYDVEIGNDNRIAEGVRICCNKFRMGNNCKIHNHVFIDGDEVILGDNVWIGQYSHLDGKGKLRIYDDVTIGYNCYIWTHADRAGLPTTHYKPTVPRRTVLRRGVWLMGANVQVNPGVIMGEFSRAYGNSVVTMSTEPGRDYGGVPAREIVVAIG